MSHQSTLLLLFHSHQDLAIQTVVEALQTIPGVRVTLDSATQVTVREDNWPITVYDSSAPHVLEESREIAELFAAQRPDQHCIATCDRRFEVVYEPEPDMLYFNTWLLTAGKLETLVEGWLFDPGLGKFLDAEPAHSPHRP